MFGVEMLARLHRFGGEVGLGLRKIVKADSIVFQAPRVRPCRDFVLHPDSGAAAPEESLPPQRRLAVPSSCSSSFIPAKVMHGKS